MAYKMNGILQVGGELSSKKVFSKQAEEISKRGPIGARKKEKPKTLESKVNDFIGNPKRAVAEVNSRYTTDEGGKFDKGRDRARHMTTAQYTTEGIRNKLDMIPFSNSTVNKLVSVGVSNIFGAAHEAKAGYANLKKGMPITDAIVETAEDLTNNFAGSIVGAMDKTSKEKKSIVDSPKVKSILPDGRGFGNSGDYKPNKSFLYKKNTNKTNKNIPKGLYVIKNKK